MSSASPLRSPYATLPARQFWKRRGAGEGRTLADGLYRKKFQIDASTQIMTAGSCFAQNISESLTQHGYTVIDEEPPPANLEGLAAKNFGYKLYSARYGNIYTARHLLQLLRESVGRSEPQDIVWERNGRFFDALRPAIEPRGLASPDEVLAHRREHLSRVRDVIGKVDLLVFTFGLTEAWVHKSSGTVYPTAPGTIAGSFDPDRYRFVNFTYEQVLDDFERVRRFLKRRRPDVKFLVTVSPVPLAATAEDQHVLSATVHSKSILRAVAGSLARRHDDVDYFPSYELIATPFNGRFYDESGRAVTAEGVDAAMDMFFREHGDVSSPNAAEVKARPPRIPSGLHNELRDEVICEDVLLDAFAP